MATNQRVDCRRPPVLDCAKQHRQVVARIAFNANMRHCAAIGTARPELPSLCIGATRSDQALMDAIVVGDMLLERGT